MLALKEETFIRISRCKLDFPQALHPQTHLESDPAKTYEETRFHYRDWFFAGVTIKKTNTALVVGIYNQAVSAGEANVVVENLGDYLIEQGC